MGLICRELGLFLDHPSGVTNTTFFGSTRHCYTTPMGRKTIYFTSHFTRYIIIE